MPTFDVVSEVDQQEVRNAVDQARREIANRYDFKDTNSSIDLGDTSIELHTASEERLRALTQVLEEKLVRRKVSLKALAYGNVEKLCGAGSSSPKTTPVNSTGSSAAIIPSSCKRAMRLGAMGRESISERTNPAQMNAAVSERIAGLSFRSARNQTETIVRTTPTAILPGSTDDR